MSQPIWNLSAIEPYTCKPARHYPSVSPKQKIMIWLVALLASWLMSLGLVKLTLTLYGMLGHLT